MTTKGIYSGLSTNEAFNLMEATREVKQELPRLESWSLGRHLRHGGAFALAASIALGAVAFVMAEDLPAKALFSGVAAALVLVAACVVVAIDAYRTVRRRERLRALSVALEQIKQAATGNPGAATADLAQALGS